ncbi:diguanylate cyclase [Paenibacillus campi]|uniref:GGDEF domain-containing protein n=1 Tax=Paenibacillus campi TaxID=3106031 RepID=UPI002AFEF9EC|nr:MULTISPECIES: diguanylate cyclase [unclassified Paenibacillus]
MINLINNLTMVTTFLFFTNLLLNKFKDSFPQYSHLYPYVSGMLHGCLGVVLMLFGEATKDGFHLDLRTLAIISAVYMGGRAAGLIALLFILISRFWLLDLSNDVAIVAGSVMIVLSYVLSAWLLDRQHRKSIGRWSIIIGSSMVIPCIAAYFLSPIAEVYGTIMVIIMYTIGGLFTYLLLTHLSRSNRSLYLLKEKASRDHLTGLYNPRAFESIFEQKMMETEKTQEPFSLLMLDIDYFKTINDTYGHSAGDAVLVCFSELLHRSVRFSDHCARKGGEEFVVLLNGCGAEQASQTAEKLRRLVEEQQFTLANGERIQVTVSIGVSTYPLTEAQLLLEQADQALYRAKREGRNRVVYY